MYNRTGVKLKFKCPETNFELYHLFEHLSSSLRMSWNRNLKGIYHLIHDNKPLSHIISDHPFLNTNLRINPRVLVPRNETENYVYELIQNIQKYRVDESSTIHILDLCSGSGCIALALASNLNNAKVTAIDKSKRCCVNILTNIVRNTHLLKQSNSKVCVKRGDIFDGRFNPGHNFDIIISNPPYIPLNLKGNVDRNVMKYESRDALFARGGTSFHEIIASLSKKLLNKDELNTNLPKIILEFDGKHQVQSLRRILNASDIRKFKFRKDLRNIPRCVWIY